MKGLLLFIGESFRLGGQHTRNRGTMESYDEQMKACDSHIKFIEHINAKYNVNVSCYISTYETQYDNKLLEKYKTYLIGNKIYNHLIGITSLYQNSIEDVKKIENIEYFDFILYIRIDLCLKEKFFDVFNPKLNTIHFSTICWHKDHFFFHNGDYKKQPRLNDNILFIPLKYFKYIQNIKLCHETWGILINTTDLTYADLDVMIDTFHDSDSQKDFNPLYYIVNRPETSVNNSKGHIFNKFIGFHVKKV